MALAEDLEQITRQERELVFAHFDAAVAWELGTRLHSLAAKRGLTVVIDIRRFGQPLFYAAMDGTIPDNVEWVRRKSNVVARFHCSSYAIGLKEKIKSETQSDIQGLPIADYATHGGSFPLTIMGTGAVGCVTVSGLPQRRDHELVIEALCALLGKDYNSLQLTKD